MHTDDTTYRLNTTALKDALKAAGWSQCEFARRAGLKESIVSRLLNGNRNLGPKTIFGLMRAFPMIPIQDFLLTDGDQQATA